MEFCNLCGILLDLKFIKGSPPSFCNPCLLVKKESYRTLPAECDCEVCSYSHENCSSFSNDDSAHLNSDTLSAGGDHLKFPQRKEKKEHPDSDAAQCGLQQNSLPQRKEKKHKGQNLSAQQSVGSKKKKASKTKRFLISSFGLIHNQKSGTQLAEDWGTCASQSWESNRVNDWASCACDETEANSENLESLENCSNTNPVSQSFLTEDWGSLSLYDSMGASCSNRPELDSDFTVVKHKRKETKDSCEGGRKEYHIVEDIRRRWEREQNGYRQQMVTEDTPEIAALVAGQRRKKNGRRYHVGGVDISFIKDNEEDGCACLSVLQMPDLQLVYQRMEMVKLTQPYIPGFLAFREVPALEPLFAHLKAEAPHYWPDITLVDGNGKLHPRGFGLACHLGVLLDIPTMGVAKSLISAQGISEDEHFKKLKRTLAGAGDGFDLISDSGEVLGKCLRVHDSAPNPVYISVGHKVSLKSAAWIALECSKFRIPEPVRMADLDSREYIRQGKTEPQEFILSNCL